MTEEQAFKLLGHNVHGIPFRNMIQALSLHPWLNTAEETEQLDAALWVRKNYTTYSAYCKRRRERRI